MTDQTPQVRAIATQLIRHAIKQIDSETACDHIVAALGEDVDVDALAFGSESAVRKARIDISWDGAPAAPPLPPVVQSPIREQLLNAIDATFCQSLGYATPEGLLAAYEASRTQTVDRAALRDRIAAAVHPLLMDTLPEVIAAARAREAADVVLAVLPATTNHDTDTSADNERRERYAAAMENARRDSTTGAVPAMDRMVDAAMAVADAEINEHREHIAVYRKDSAAQYQIIAELQRENALLRRVADETAATETAHQPRRGDQFEAWLKTQRNSFGWQGANDRRLYDTLDGILDRYRLYADTGTPLGEHVCETKAVGDCECLEQPATETCDHDSQVIDHEGAQYWACLKCGTNLGRVEPAAGPRQDGAQQ